MKKVDQDLRLASAQEKGTFDQNALSFLSPILFDYQYRCLTTVYSED